MKLDLVIVEWVDAHTGHGWERDDEADGEGSIVFTVGFLVRSTRQAITVASTTDRKGANNSRITIPRGMVKAIRRTSVRSGRSTTS